MVMMKAVSFLSLIISEMLTSMAVVASDLNVEYYRPVRVDYQDDILSNRNNNLWMETLQQVGMVSISNMPSSFQEAKRTVQQHLSACLQASTLTKSHVFPDGTKRSTLATHTTTTITAAVLNILDHQVVPSDYDDDSIGPAAACHQFEAASVIFREHVDLAVRSFAQRVSEYCTVDDPVTTTPQHQPRPLLQGVEQEIESFDTMWDVVHHGEHLEHFHNYQPPLTKHKKDETNDMSTATIDWHTDQGLFLAFTPGILIKTDASSDDLASPKTDGFYIELADGRRPMVQFQNDDDQDSDQDHLILLMGDGMNQLLSNGHPYCNFRAVPHALFMPSIPEKTEAFSRVWYGRMVLPPASAIHPQYQHAGSDFKTFGEIRQLLIDNMNNLETDTMYLGCSGGSHHVARQLEETSCEEGTLLCK
jgi:hypothetical protein